MNNIQLYHGDCLDVLKTLESGSVDAVVTSPPYNCGKNYGTASDNRADYWTFTGAWVSESYRILAPGGRLCVNLPWWMGKKPRLEVPFMFHRIATERSFLFLDKIIWAKGDEGNLHVSGGYGGGGSGWGTWCSPSGPAVRCASEPILIFAKKSRGRKRISGLGNGNCLKGDMSKEEFLAWTIDVWMVRGQHDPEHPAVFPAEIPQRLIRLYTYPGETILDPFMGSGATGAVCVRTGRNFIGIEIDKGYFAIAQKRITEAQNATPLFAGLP